MTPELDRLRERLRQHRDTVRRELLTPAAGAPSDDQIGLSFTPGARVFDRVTGETGVILGGKREQHST